MSRFLAFSLSLLALALPLSGAAAPKEIGRPIVMTPSDSSPTPGELVLVTVTLSSAASQSDIISIDSLTPTNLALCPTSVQVNAGDTSESFYIQLSSQATGALQLSATEGSNSASMKVLVAGLSTQSQSEGLLTNVRF